MFGKQGVALGLERTALCIEFDDRIDEFSRVEILDLQFCDDLVAVFAKSFEC